jgi:ATP-dependent Lon protease
MRADGSVFAVALRGESDEPDPEHLYTMGVVARITQLQRGLGALQLLLVGQERAVATEFQPTQGFLQAVLRTVASRPALDQNDAAYLALARELRAKAFEFATRLGLPEEAQRQALDSVTDPGAFADLVATHLDLAVPEKQLVLETLDVEERMRRVLVHLQRQLELLDAQRYIQDQVKEELGSRQREMYLREQMRAIQRELGDNDPGSESEQLRDKIRALDLPPEARAEAERELGRLQRSGPESMEAQIIRTYLQWFVELPWHARSEDRLELDRAARILDEDHYGLNDVKDRVLEFLAVRQLRARAAAHASDRASAPNAAESARDRARAMAHGPILLFVGPPGVGKTSIAQSIARALDRKYVRVSLGGARDEADIRGHRRTYVGAMPGRIIHGLKHAGTKNPVFLLDEIDKLGISFQGDPAAALLEVLDPAQNNTFTDHYLNVPFDLSEVLFITTANVLHTIPPALLDRMEQVDFNGYTEREKVEIARRYLVVRELEEAGMNFREGTPEFSNEAIRSLIAGYTRESGVRQLERRIGAVARKLARRVASGQPSPQKITQELVRELLGRPRMHPERAQEANEVGVATGMYYTPAGGDIMFVEAAIRRLLRPVSSDNIVTGWGDVAMILTGQLGDVMKESARAALTYAATHAKLLGIAPSCLGSIEVHVHVPAGAVPKDGPSAGVTIATALASAMSGRAVRREVAMTGEITLHGRVLPIGGVKEKVLGADRAGIAEVILPKGNELDLEDVPEEVRSRLHFHCVSSLEQVFDIALCPPSGMADSHELAPRAA